MSLIECIVSETAPEGAAALLGPRCVLAKIFERRAVLWLKLWRRDKGAGSRETALLKTSWAQLILLAELALEEPLLTADDLFATLEIVSFFDLKRPWCQSAAASEVLGSSVYVEALSLLAEIKQQIFEQDRWSSYQAGAPEKQSSQGGAAMKQMCLPVEVQP